MTKDAGAGIKDAGAGSGLQRYYRAIRYCLVTASLAGVLCSAVAADTVYRWTDAEGNTVLSDRPPGDRAISFETLQTRERSPSSASSGQESRGGGASGTASGSGRDSLDGARLVPEVTPDPEICQQARNNLEILDRKPRIRVYGDDGELRYLSPAEMEQQRERALQAIELHCRE